MCRQSKACFRLDRISVGLKPSCLMGQFGSYIMEKFSFSERAAQSYMNAAAAFKGKTAIVAHLPPTVLYELAAKSTPPAVREDIVALLESGSSLGPEEIATRLC